MFADRPPTAPAHLSATSKALWKRVVTTFETEAVRLTILLAALEARDRMAQAREAIERDGAYITGRFGMKAHPALAVERDSRLAMLRSFRELGLDDDPGGKP